MTTTLITGSSGDIGAAIATALAGEGQTLYLHYHRGERRVQDVRDQCEAQGAKTVLVPANLQTAEGIETLVAGTRLPVDHIVLANGQAYYGLFTDMDDLELLDLFALNLTVPMRIIKRFLPAMISQKYGRVVAISSLWGEVGAAYEVAYSAAKGGLNQFVQALAKEVAPSNITVNGVSPGVVATKMMDTFDEEDMRLLAETIPAGRLATVNEVASACQYLLSPEAGYVNGHILSINGAWGG
ncbi:elongation factor P 5-aminopentanone reductase [Natribacillus halophilus]|uniref:3-oxoacyl-[acyl-carrier protein] reductase n=1 Tax=Natribacillus halophilus TaxID=549003 RepID=A0A1G8PTG2_9BACI|nr:SDR family oxidoreductase [Natribacillus halophilus]SDI95160.1 3-oxoacyl-[acyl-carrier protein] reductase [Natribacillus halophilus]